MEGAQLLLLLGQNLRALSTVVRASAEPDRTAHWSGSEEEILAEYSPGTDIRKAVAAEQREWAAVFPWREAGAASLHALFQDLSAWFAGGGPGLEKRRAGRKLPSSRSAPPSFRPHCGC